MASDADVDGARAAGFDEYLGKPVSIERLVGALRRVARDERQTRTGG